MLTQLLENIMPGLSSEMTLEKTVVTRDSRRMLVCFSANRLIDPRTEREVRKHLRDRFPDIEVRTRVTYPRLGEALAAGDIAPYVEYITSAIAARRPAIRTMLTGAQWQIREGGLHLDLTSELAMDFVREHQIDALIARMLSEVFRVTLPVIAGVPGDEAERRDRLEAERNASAKQLEELRAATTAALEAIEPPAPQKTARGVAKPSGALYGRAIKAPVIPISELTEDTGSAVVCGEVVSVESREVAGGSKMLFSFRLTDFAGTLTLKLFAPTKGGEANPGGNGRKTRADAEKQLEAITVAIREGEWLTARGDYRYDTFSREHVLMVSDLECAQKIERQDNATGEKRVELHLHTQMSAMDSVLGVTDAIKTAARWGHKAIAITDHGVLQALPEAFAAAGKSKIKLIPGCEAYLGEDTATVVKGADDRPLPCTFVVFDLETTGLSDARDAIIEIGAVRMEDGEVVAEFSELINPLRPIPEESIKVHKITDAMVAGKRTLEEVLPDFLAFCEGAALAAHNASFDMGFIMAALRKSGTAFDPPVLDTLTFSRCVYPALKSHRLASVCKHLGISLKNAHRAVHDARATAQALLRMMADTVEAHGIERLSELNDIFTGSPTGASRHILLLAKSQKGLENLNRLVSLAHLEHFHRRPHIPRAELIRWREGLIVGSACEQGELFRAMLDGADDDTLLRIAEFYDYLEIQPVGNNEFLIREGRAADEEALRDFNRRIVRLAESLNKPVVATGDVHFLNPNDAQFRAILMAGMGFEDADLQAPLYFKTTDEMLEEFAYLGEDAARRVVIEAPGAIADSVEKIGLFIPHPKNEETFQPYWEDAADDIKRMTLTRAHEIYGEELPELIEARLDKELGSIIGYGFATLYSIAQKLVSKSLGDGYIVGSRGSVGSSFVAHMVGITEVNPLPPHYVCPACHHTDFEVSASCGLDLPPRDCPQCGAAYRKDGFDIPFEVFLGFEGDKVPDIDLNFSGEYQPVAHAYVEELFGQGNVFRAGTIGTLAEKTAYGYVIKYLEERGREVNQAEKERLVKGCVGVKRTTGQHPGGIVVLPKDYEIYQFTAIQHPADDVKTSTITTHYDFGSMHDVLVKLDILGHDDPTMLRRLQEMTGIAPHQVPLDDPEVFKAIMSLFQSPDLLGFTREEYDITSGTLGIPEFGTRFVRQMLEDTHPSTMEELIRISGLSHGTDVWLGNAQELIRQGVAALRECICTRDDIMNNLIRQGVPAKMAFNTMESVRKGKGLTGEMEEAMLAADTPTWVIESCKKIKYMFPKSHAAAYVIMALRIAYFKIYYPTQYYACYLARNRESFDASTMVAAAPTLKIRMDQLSLKGRDATPKEQDELSLLEVLLEMHARGIRVLPVDVYKSDAEHFLMEAAGLIRAPLSTLPGVGLSASAVIVRERAAGPFTSRQEMVRRKIGQAVVDILNQNGCLGDMPLSSQVSLFDFSAG